MESPDVPDSPSCREAVVARDLQECLPLTSLLDEDDLLYLLTPVVVPTEPPSPSSSAKDPFEPLGKALAKYHSRIRHVPYTVRDGITQYHANHLALAKAVVFVINGPQCGGQTSQVELSRVVRDIAPNKPLIVIVCCSLSLLEPCETFFPTLIEAKDYSISCLECAADLLFTAPGSWRARAMLPMHPSQTRWLSEEWHHENDLTAVHELWCKCMPEHFHLGRDRLHSLLQRPGYIKHFIVRDQSTRNILGFCATYTTFISSDTPCVGCIAAILVEPSHRGRGIGSALYYYSLRQVVEHDKVTRLQIGSAFPRLLLGPFAGSESEEWFRRRGWRIDASGLPGTGQDASDWVLDLSEWRVSGLSDNGLTFMRFTEREDLGENELIEFVTRESARHNNVGWYDQYLINAQQPHAKGILVVFEGNQLVATAISYVCGKDSRMAEDLPWPDAVSDSAGGVSCICITEDRLSTNNTRDMVMLRLINFSVQILKSEGLEKMFLDGVRGGEEGFQSVGFQKWASYKEVWREI
ncbi:hypothetical protein SEPCBS119000_000301 [Sporothrix epigloea]|uniref:N-acetyltransferase domain-containing protein n=1 Tax=Sporothrix epigloea TaxID=1892477 RepID=A0ABP0D635_9PEZI